MILPTLSQHAPHASALDLVTGSPGPTVHELDGSFPTGLIPGLRTQAIYIYTLHLTHGPRNIMFTCFKQGLYKLSHLLQREFQPKKYSICSQRRRTVVTRSTSRSGDTNVGPPSYSMPSAICLTCTNWKRGRISVPFVMMKSIAPHGPGRTNWTTAHW